MAAQDPAPPDHQFQGRYRQVRREQNPAWPERRARHQPDQQALAQNPVHPERHRLRLVGLAGREQNPVPLQCREQNRVYLQYREQDLAHPRHLAQGPEVAERAAHDKPRRKIRLKTIPGTKMLRLKNRSKGFNFNNKDLT